MALEKDRLTDAEIALKETEEATGAVSPTGQTGLAIGQVAELQSQIISREVQLDAMRNSSTDQNPDVIRLNSELAEPAGATDARWRTFKPGKGRNPGDISLSPRALPADQLQFLRKQRDVQYHTLIFDLIARQFEAARLDEAKASPVIQVLDPAEPPDRKSSPYPSPVDLDRGSPWFRLRVYPGNRLLRLWRVAWPTRSMPRSWASFKRALRFRST